MDRGERSELGDCSECGYGFWEAGAIQCSQHRAITAPNPLDGELTPHIMSDLAVDLRAELDRKLADQSRGANSTYNQGNDSLSQTGTETPEPTQLAGDKAETPIILEDSIPPPRKYAHSGKRRRSYTDELFRCQFVDMISRTPLICNHLLWRNNLPALRDHLAEHMKVEEVQKLTDSQVKDKYAEAKRIFLERIPEDGDPEEDSDDESDTESDDEALGGYDLP